VADSSETKFSLDLSTLSTLDLARLNSSAAQLSQN